MEYLYGKSFYRNYSDLSVYVKLLFSEWLFVTELAHIIYLLSGVCYHKVCINLLSQYTDVENLSITVPLEKSKLAWIKYHWIVWYLLHFILFLAASLCIRRQRSEGIMHHQLGWGFFWFFFPLPSVKAALNYESLADLCITCYNLRKQICVIGVCM